MEAGSNQKFFLLFLAYDDEALGFQKGDIIVIDRKDDSGNWTGRIVKKANSNVVESSKRGLEIIHDLLFTHKNIDTIAI